MRFIAIACAILLSSCHDGGKCQEGHWAKAVMMTGAGVYTIIDVWECDKRAAPDGMALTPK